MADDRRLKIILGAEDQASKVFKGLAGNANRMADQMKKVGKQMAIVGGAATAAFGFAVKTASDFETGMREVNTLVNLSESQFASLSKQTRDLAKDMGVDAVGATKALYQAISAGQSPADALGFLEVAARASIGGVTDLETAVDGLTTIVNAFGMESSEVGHVADVMFATVRGGKTTMDELSNSMFQAAPVAAAAGVSLEEMSAAVATITKQGTPTKVAMTGLRGAMLGLLRPSEDMRILLDELGFSTGRSAIEQLGLVGALDAVRTATKGNDEQLAKAIGSMEGLTPVLQVTGDNLRTFKKDLHDISTAAGASDKAFKEMQKTSARQFDLMKATFTELKISVGTTLLPIFNDVANALAPVIEGIAKFAENHGGLVKAIAIGAAVLLGLGTAMAVLGFILGPIIAVIGVLAGAFAAAAASGGILAGVMAVLSGPVGIALLVAGVGVAAIAVKTLTGGLSETTTAARGSVVAIGEMADSFNRLPEELEPIRVGFEEVAAAADLTADALHVPITKAVEEVIIAANELNPTFETMGERMTRVQVAAIDLADRGLSHLDDVTADTHPNMVTFLADVWEWIQPMEAVQHPIAEVSREVSNLGVTFADTHSKLEVFQNTLTNLPALAAYGRAVKDAIVVTEGFAHAAGVAASQAVDNVTERMRIAGQVGAMWVDNFSNSFEGIEEVITRAVDPMKFFLKNIKNGFDETAQSAEDLKQAILGLSNLSAGNAGKVINAAFDEALRQAGKGNLIGATFEDTVLAGGGANIVAGATAFEQQNQGGYPKRRAAG